LSRFGQKIVVKVFEKKVGKIVLKVLENIFVKVLATKMLSRF